MKSEHSADISLAVVGDVALGSLPGDILDRVSEILGEHDIKFCNLEGPISDRGAPKNKIVVLRSKPEAMETLKTGFNVVSFANNHCMDYGADALLHTLQLLDENGIAHAGAGKDIFAAHKPAILTVKDCRVAFLAYASMADLDFKATERYPGLAPVRVDPLYAPPHLNEEDLSWMIADIRTAKEHADLVVVSHHWGVSVSHTLTLYQRHLAHQTIDSGADFVIGGHPHVMQGIELYKGKVICYSLGNFIFEDLPHFLTASNETAILTCQIRKKKIAGVFLRPVVTNQLSQPEPVAPGTELFDTIFTRVRDLSVPLKTTLSVREDKIWISD